MNDFVPSGEMRGIPSGQIFDFGFEFTDISLARFDEEDGFPVSALIPPDVETQEGEAFIYMGEEGFTFTEFQFEVTFKKLSGFLFEFKSVGFSTIPQQAPVKWAASAQLDLCLLW